MPKIKVFSFNDQLLSETEAHSIAEIIKYKKSKRCNWVQVIGSLNLEFMEEFSKKFGVHHITIENILNKKHQPAIEDLEDHIFLLLKSVKYDEEKMRLDIDQVSLLLGKNYVISFQEKDDGLFDQIAKRLKNRDDRIRKSGSDYFTYELLDNIADNYFIALDDIEVAISKIENVVISKPRPDVLNKIYRLDRQTLLIRKFMWPMREVVSEFQKLESPLIKSSTDLYLREVYNHVLHAMDLIEMFREIMSELLNMYLSSVNNRLNEVMKVLTVMSSIFIPLSFLAGVYGMNFRYMPELAWRWGYPLLIGIMVLVAIVLLAYFKKRDWF